MRSIILTSIFAFLFTAQAFSQNKPATITGSVKDTTSGPLSMATVMLLQAADSVLNTFGMTDDKGQFSLPRVLKGEYLLQVTYIGYRNFSQKISVPGTGDPIDVGAIKLEPQSELLSEVIVEGEANPLNIKKDTVEYNAVAFKTQPNAVVEELLKKLPGVEVEADGTVKAQGENVTRVLVDGKEFFGRDPKMATRNLPADAVDKVQIFDKLSDQAEFSGVDDGQREKTINISLREDRRRGMFGTGTLAGGSAPDLPSEEAGRYEGKLTLNRFSKNQQISFLGMANNINQVGFSPEEYIGFTGGGGGGGMRMGGGGGGFGGGNDAGVPVNFGGGGSNGYVNTYAGGLNFNRSLGKKTDLQASYFYSFSDRETIRSTYRENFLTNNQSFFNDDESTQNQLSGSHRINMTLEHKFDSTQRLRLISRITAADTDYELASRTQSLNNEKALTNNSVRDNTSNGNNLSINSNLIYNKRFNRRGRNFSANLSLVSGNDESDGWNNSTNGFFTGSNPRIDTLNQNFFQNNDRLNYGARLSYVEPAGRNKYVEVTYDYQSNNNDFNREVYDYLDGNTFQINAGLTNQYEVAFSYHQPGLRWRLAKENFNMSVGANYQFSVLDGTLLASETEIREDYQAFLPNLNMRWTFGSNKFLNAEYRTNIQAPSIQQLQPVVDNTNPLSIYEGNPELNPEYSHSMNLRIGSFNQFSFTNIFGFVNFTYTKDRIRNAQTIDENLVTTTKPINVDDDYRMFSRFSIGTRIRPLKTSINFDLGLNWNRGITFINAQQNWTTTTAPNTGLRFENTRKDKWDWSIGANLRYSHATYSVATEQNRDFLNSTYSANLMIPFYKKRFNLNSSLNYAVYTGLSGDDFNQDIPIWNAFLAFNFLKNQRGQLKLAAYDLLNQNLGISRTNELNYTLDERVNSLGRFFTLGFTYAVRGMGGNARQNMQIHMH